MPLLSDDRVRLNYVNLENNRIKPATIILTEQEKAEIDLRRILSKLPPMVMLSRLRRNHHDRTRKQ